MFVFQREKSVAVRFLKNVHSECRLWVAFLNSCIAQ